MTDTAQTFGTKTTDRSGNAMETAYEETKDAVLEGAHRAKEAMVEGHQAVKRFTEESPHSAALMYVGLGIVVGVVIGMSLTPSKPKRWYE